MGHHAGVPMVLTAPLTESIDHAGFFIQMSLASIPGWMEWVIDKKYPAWRAVPTTAEGRAGTAPAGLRVLEAVLAHEFGVDHVVVCYPEQLPEFIGERTRVVAVSTHNPLGTTFAAGVYASIFGSSRAPVNALYARRMFDTIRVCRQRHSFAVILGGSDAWQVGETWQVIMKAWAVASRIGLQSTWGKLSFGAGALVLWAARLRRVNGPNFTWPLVQFSGVVPERWLERMGSIYGGRPLPQVTRNDLLATVRPDWREAIAAACASRPPAQARQFRMAVV